MPDLFSGWPTALRALAITAVVCAVAFGIWYVLWPDEPFNLAGGIATGIVIALLDGFRWNRAERGRE